MKSGEAKLHTGIVVDAFNDLSIKVTVRTYADTVIDDVGPEAVGAVRYRPRVGDKVRILERVAPLRPEKALTWLGWAWDPEDTRLIPPWLEADEVALLSQDGVVGIVLEDIPEDVTGRTVNAAGWPAATAWRPRGSRRRSPSRSAAGYTTPSSGTPCGSITTSAAGSH